jgi:hypothetical protein
MRLFALSRLANLIGLALVALLAWPGAASAESPIETSTQSARYPIDAVVVVDCANGGAGEAVHLTGIQHIIYHANDYAGVGTLLFVTEVNTQVRGVGLTTGDVFVGSTESGTFVTRQVGPGEDFSNSRFVRLIGQGTAPNLLFHEIDHVTVDANGVITATVTFDRFECR